MFHTSFIITRQKYKFTSVDVRWEIFRVYIELCKTALNHWAFRIHKCYIISINNKCIFSFQGDLFSIHAGFNLWSWVYPDNRSGATMRKSRSTCLEKVGTEMI